MSVTMEWFIFKELYTTFDRWFVASQALPSCEDPMIREKKFQKSKWGHNWWRLGSGEVSDERIFEYIRIFE